MQVLLDLPNPRDSASLHRFYDSMENHIQSLKGLGKTQDNYGDLLVPIILSKLLIHEHRTTDWVLEQLQKAIYRGI